MGDVAHLRGRAIGALLVSVVVSGITIQPAAARAAPGTLPDCASAREAPPAPTTAERRRETAAPEARGTTPSSTEGAGPAAAPEARAARSSAAAPRLVPQLDGRGWLAGHRAIVPTAAGTLVRDVAAEAFVTVAAPSLVAVGEDDGSESRVTVVDVERACRMATLRATSVVRSALVDGRSETVYTHEVDRASRRDLGVRARSLGDATRPSVAVPPLVGIPGGGGGDGRIAATELSWEDPRTLLVRSCSRHACLVRRLDVGTGTVRVEAIGDAADGRAVMPPDGARGVAATTVTAGESRPTPPNGPTWPANEALTFRWRPGAAPPAWMASAMRSAADDVGSSRGSRAPTVRFDADASDVIGYETSLPCGATSIGCATKDVGSWWRVGIRVHGWWYDWGQLRWCQALETPVDGCFDAELVTLHELGHVVGLGHYEDAYGPGETPGPWGDSVMHVRTHARGESWWNAHEFGRCDVTTLQRRYDMQDTYARYADCARHDTAVGLDASATSVRYGNDVTLTATLRVVDRDGYGKVGGNRVSGRTVLLQRRAPGTDSWTSYVMYASGSDGTYRRTLTPGTTYEYRAVFGRPSEEGLDGNTSVVLTVRVADCTSGCPLASGRDGRSR